MKQKILLFFMLFVSALCKAQQEDVSMVLFIQDKHDPFSTLSLKNNTDEEITSVRFNIEYYNMSDVMEDYAEFNEEVTIAPRMTKKINIKAYEENRNYVYETSKDTYNVTRFKVKYKYIGCTKTNMQGSITQSFQGQNSKDVANKDAICDVVEKMPSFPGGTAALMQYLSSHIRFVPTAEENGIQGRVITTFVVCKDGSISNVEVTKSVDPSLDREAVRVVKSMPNWNPGVDKDGNYVNVKYTLPLTFRLQ